MRPIAVAGSVKFAVMPLLAPHQLLSRRPTTVTMSPTLTLSSDGELSEYVNHACCEPQRPHHPACSSKATTTTSVPTPSGLLAGLASAVTLWSCPRAVLAGGARGGSPREENVVGGPAAAS